MGNSWGYGDKSVPMRNWWGIYMYVPTNGECHGEYNIWRILYVYTHRWGIAWGIHYMGNFIHVPMNGEYIMCVHTNGDFDGELGIKDFLIFPMSPYPHRWGIFLKLNIFEGYSLIFTWVYSLIFTWVIH